jgi:hypothetical protein
MCKTYVGYTDISVLRGCTENAAPIEANDILNVIIRIFVTIYSFDSLEDLRQ